MRIGVAHPFSWPEVRRGAERYVEDLSWYLVGQGHEVEIITGTDGPTSTERRSDGALVHRVHHVGMVQLARLGIDKVQAFFLTALPVLRERSYDVVHAMVPGASCAAAAARIPSVFTFIGHPTRTQFDALTRMDRLLYRSANRWSSATTALSETSAASVQDLLGRRPEILPPGVRLDRFPTGSGVGGPPRLLFSAAAEDRRKHLDLALQALPAVLDAHPDARLQISGAGDPGWAIEQLHPVDRPRVAAAVDVLGVGSTEEIPQRYRDATLTVLPAEDEAFGLALVESLASGTPVVASADGGMVDIITDDAIGRTFPVGSVEALARALIEVIDVARCADTPTSCRRHARQWGWIESIGPAHERLYRRVHR